MSPNRPKPESLLDSASDYFGALRWRAANALTASLSPEERSRLLERLDPDGHGLSKKEPTADNVAASVAAAAPIHPPVPRQSSSNHVPTVSIAEAVAAARAQEAQLHMEKWEREKERLIQEAEKAAYERVESSLAIQKRRMAFEAWKKSVEKSQQQNQTQASSPLQQQQPTPDIQEALVSDESSSSLVSHPILGPAVADLGHKRIHLVSAQALSAIPVWRKQRIYRHGRAKSMASDKLKTMHLGLPGIIGIYEVRLAFP
jgi:hypothetical protein